MAVKWQDSMHVILQAPWKNTKFRDYNQSLVINFLNIMRIIYIPDLSLLLPCMRACFVIGI